MTIDTKEDLNFVEKLLKKFNYNLKITNKEIIEFYNKNENFFDTKNKIRNEGMTMNLGQKYWIRANEVIPGGTMLFSKNLTYIFLTYGQLIFQEQKDAMFGI